MQTKQISRTIFDILFFLCLSSTGIFSADLSADAILDSMDSVMQPEVSQGKMEQEIITSSHEKRIFTFEYFSSNKGEDVLIRYQKPKKVKNNAFLIKNNGDDIWIYFPRTRRVRKLASHARKQKAQGSDFSYEDFSGSKEWKKDYYVNHEFSGEDNNYLLVFTPRPEVDTGYDELRIFVNKLNYYPDRIQYFKKGEHFKTLTFKDVIDIQGFPTAKIMHMNNHVEDSQTTMKILEMKYDVKFEEDFFTERNLKK